MSGINAGGIYSELVLNGSNFFDTIKKADSEMKGLESKFKDYGDKMISAGKNWTTKVSLPVAGIGAVATKLGMDFESAMSQVGAISGATGDDLVILEKKARDMGATTKFSASDAAEGLKYMAMAGWETNSMLEGLDGVLALAAASGEDLGMVSDIVTDALTAFGMQAKDAGKFADLLASASSNSNTNVAMMGETFKYAAPIAGALGFSAEDTALAIGLMANSGIKASQAGTSLRSIMSELTGDVKFLGEEFDGTVISTQNADGTMRGFSDILVDLRGKFKGMTEAQQAANAENIAGKEAMSGFLAIMNASEEDFIKLTKATTDYTGTAKEMSDMMQNNLKGRWEEFKSGLEEAALQIYDLLLPSLESLLAKGKQFIDWFQELDDGTKKTIINIAGLAASIGPLLVVGGTLAKSISSIVGLFGLMSGGAATAAAATTAATTPVWALGGAASASALLLNPWTLGIAAAGIGVVALARHLREDAIPEVDLFGEGVSKSTEIALGGFLELEDKAGASLRELAWSGREVTAQMAEGVIANYDAMAQDLITKIEEQKHITIDGMTYMSDESAIISEDQRSKIYEILNRSFDEQIEKTKEGQARITEIITTAVEEKRILYQAEEDEIDKIRNSMRESAVQTLTASQEEQLLIMEKLRTESGKIAALQASEIVKSSIEQRDGVIAEAEQSYEEQLKVAAKLRQEGGAEAEMYADLLVQAAKKQKEETIAEAEEMHEKIVEEAKAQAKDHVAEVDWTTGELKEKWELMVENSKTSMGNLVQTTGEKFAEWGEKIRIATEEANTDLKESLNKMVEDAKEAGSNWVQGLWKGITDSTDWLVGKVRGFSENVSSNFKGFWGIQSPSRLMAEYGNYLVEGLAEGLDKNKQKALDEMSKLSKAVDSAFNQVQSSVKQTVSIIEKEFTLWQLQNQRLKGTSEDLERQLVLQKEKQELLTETVGVATTAMETIIAKYGAGSEEALRYKETLLGLQIEHQKLTNDINASAAAMQKLQLAQNLTAIKGKLHDDKIMKDFYASQSGGDSDNSSSSRDPNDEAVYGYVDGKLTAYNSPNGFREVLTNAMDRLGDKFYGSDIGNILGGSEARDRYGISDDEYEDLVRKHIGDGVTGHNAQGTNYWGGGLTWVGEQGPELIELPKASKVYSNPQSMEISKQSGGVVQHIEIHSPTPLSPSEIARKNLQASRQLAMEWGF